MRRNLVLTSLVMTTKYPAANRGNQNLEKNIALIQLGIFQTTLFGEPCNENLRKNIGIGDRNKQQPDLLRY